ncbi:MAG: bis(5'-nucleosyl)-tetraphosphatase (symmetrical) YqeK, partial [Clostridiales bacterium]|nr:bis(5'-nucleosyl)-tetraphosphatase (symmetrical) YqeK [Clostridiales bacterium]
MSNWQNNRDGVSYSSDAVRHYKEKYPEAELSFVIGSDCLGALPEWHEADYLAANAVFYVIARPGFPIRKAQIEILAELGFTVKRGFKGEDESSSLVRVAAAFGKTDELLPAEVAAHIEKHNLYNDYTPFTRAFKTFGMKSERIEHTFRAVKAGIKLAKIHGEDVDSVITALILHDIGKYADRGSLLNNNVHVSDEVYKLPSPVIHAHVSAAIARDYFHTSDQIVTAIARHTTGAAGMTALDQIVYLADATEEGRSYEEAPKIAKLAAKDLDRAMRRALKLSIAEVKKNGNTLHADTAEAYAYFRTLCATRAAEAKAAPVFAPKSDKAEKKGKEEKGKKSEKAKEKNLSESKALADYIAARLSEKKGKDVVLINVGQRTVIADYFVVCGANSTTAVRALADYVDEKLSKEQGIEPL